MAKERNTPSSTSKRTGASKNVKASRAVRPKPRSKNKSNTGIPLKPALVEAKVPLNDLIVQTILDKKGSHISLMDLRGLDGPTDYFIVCEADNITLTKALSDHIYRSVKSDMGITPNHIEGVAQAKWILVDYFTTVVHIFYKETRKYYEIDQLWSDAKTIEFHQV